MLWDVEAAGGWRSKNKNPTQWCGEQWCGEWKNSTWIFCDWTFLLTLAGITLVGRTYKAYSCQFFPTANTQPPAHHPPRLCWRVSWGERNLVVRSSFRTPNLSVFYVSKTLVLHVACDFSGADHDFRCPQNQLRPKKRLITLWENAHTQSTAMSWTLKLDVPTICLA